MIFQSTNGQRNMLHYYKLNQHVRMFQEVVALYDSVMEDLNKNNNLLQQHIMFLQLSHPVFSSTGRRTLMRNHTDLWSGPLSPHGKSPWCDPSVHLATRLTLVGCLRLCLFWYYGNQYLRVVPGYYSIFPCVPPPYISIILILDFYCLHWQRCIYLRPALSSFAK